MFVYLGHLQICVRCEPTGENRSSSEYHVSNSRSATIRIASDPECVWDFLLNVFRHRFVLSGPRMAATGARHHHHGDARHAEPAAEPEKGIDGTRLEDAIRLLNERQGEIAKGVSVTRRSDGTCSPTHSRGLLKIRSAIDVGDCRHATPD